MKFSASIILCLNLASFSAAAIVTMRTKRQTMPECSLVECIVNLAELPLQITTCAEAVEDFNDLSIDRDPIKLTAQSTDCIAEATLAGIELPSHCAGCVAVLDGECPHEMIPCTGPPSS